MDKEVQDLTDEHEENNGNIVDAMAVGIAAWLVTVGSVPRARLRKYVYDTFPDVVAPYQVAAINEAYGFYLKQRMLIGAVVPLTPPTHTEMTAIRDAANKTGPIVSAIMKNSYIGGVVQQAVTDAVVKVASNSILETDKATQVTLSQKDDLRSRTIWSAEADSCPWCADMDGTEVSEINSHDNCKCSLVTEFY